MNDLELPRLYKKSKTGAVVICDIIVRGDNIKLVTGQIDGKKIAHWTKCYPKNEGKKNATTSLEQAQKEARAKWAKKVKSGYVEEIMGEQTVQLPMKIKKYQDQIQNVEFPCYASPKLNGVNGIYRCEWINNDPDNGIGFVLTSRGGDTRPELPHLEKELNTVMTHLDSNAINGELYIHGMHLQDISSAVTKTNSNSPKLQFHVFEICDSDEDYQDKVIRFNKIDNSPLKFVKIIRAKVLTSHEDINKYLHECLENGYEGIVIRNPKCKYVYNIRSSDAFKYKIPRDGEYKIIGYKLDKNGHPVFKCVTPMEHGSYEFNVKIKGTDEERREIANIADTWIGKWLKIEFEDYSKIMKPLKPVGLCLRECDDGGNPTE